METTSGDFRARTNLGLLCRSQCVPSLAGSRVDGAQTARFGSLFGPSTDCSSLDSLPEPIRQHTGDLISSPMPAKRHLPPISCADTSRWSDEQFLGGTPR